MTNKFNLIQIYFLLFLLSMTGQTTHQDDNFDRINNASFSNGNYVDTYTGKVNTSIPIFQHVGKEISLPINLNYSTVGIRVDQLAGSTGLGWNLNVAGTINRKINDNRDSSPIIAGQNAIDPRDLYEMNVSGIQEYFQIQEPYAKAKALLDPSYHSNYRVSDTDEWVITNTLDGTKYYFGENNIVENSSTYSIEHPTVVTNIDNWMLTKIESKNNLDVYTFIYQNFEQQNYITLYGNGHRNEFGNLRNKQTEYKSNRQVIKEIYHNGEKIISFNYQNRDDVYYVNGTNIGNALSEILLYNYKSTTPYKKTVFSYSYFGNLTTPIIANTNNVHVRLKLDSITSYGWNQTEWEAGENYQFNYKDPQNVPSIYSFARDYLGLYNGKNTNNLMHLYNNANSSPPDNSTTISERNYNFTKSLSGTLYKVVNPRKGYTEFEFEQNKMDSINVLRDGFRIKSVSSFTSENNLVSKKEYNYGRAHFFLTIIAGNTPWGYTYPSVLFYDKVTEYSYGQSLAYMGKIENKYKSLGYLDPYYESGIYGADYPYYGIRSGGFRKNIELFDTKTNNDIKERNTYDSNDRLIKKEKFTYDGIGYPATYWQVYTDADGNQIDHYETVTRWNKFMTKKETFEYPIDDIEIYRHSDYTKEVIDPHYNGIVTLLPTEEHNYLNNEEISYVQYSGYIRHGSSSIGNIYEYNENQLVKTKQYHYSPLGVLTGGASAKGEEDLVVNTQSEWDAVGNIISTVQVTPGTIANNQWDSFIYGYDNRFVVAKLTGIKYSDIPTSLIDAIKTASNQEITPTNITAMETALSALRDSTDTDLQNAQITTYTYNPVYGVTSVTDPKGMTIYTEYDAFGRVKLTKEKTANGDLKILSENQYNTRPN